VDKNSAWQCGACDGCLRGTERLKDYASEAQKVLSAYQALGSRTSATKVLHVLRGSRAKDIPEDFQMEPIHGQGRERSLKYWQVGLRLCRAVCDCYRAAFDGVPGALKGRAARARRLFPKLA